MANLGTIGMDTRDTFSEAMPVVGGEKLGVPLIVQIDASVGLTLPVPVAVPSGGNAGSATIASLAPSATIRSVP